MGFPVFNFDEFLGENDSIHFPLSSDLCQKFWDKYKHPTGKTKWDLDPIVRKKLIKISESFIGDLEESIGDSCTISDIRLVGPMCGPHYSEDSPLEVEIVFDLDSQKEKKALIAEKINHQAFLWQSKPEVTLRGHEVDLEVIGVGESRVKSGIYSLKQNKWIKPPNLEEKENFGVDEKKAMSVCYLLEKLERIQSSEFADAKIQKQIIKKIQSNLGKLRKKAYTPKTKSLAEQSAYRKLLEGGYIQRLVKMLEHNTK